ncbi:MAG: RIP metalloprotease RseP, partial [Planctomycetes bacterium]|nr:RIP metalloprotease RseP [Planctomycetota bacterium]
FAVLGIGFIIFIHELGHYLAARAVGIRVEAFSIGFGKRLFGWTRGATEYKVCLIPLGGYVKMAGEDPTKPTTGRPDEFGSKKVWQRVLVISAGVIMNLIFALVAVPIAFAVGVPFEEPVVGMVNPGSPAWESGVRHGDRVLAVDGSKVLTFLDILQDVAVSDGPVTLTVERDGKERDIDVTPSDPNDFGIPRIGANIAFHEFSVAPDWLDSDGKNSDEMKVVHALREAGLDKDSRVIAVNDVPVTNGAWLNGELRRARMLNEGLRLRLKGDPGREVVLPPLLVDDEGRKIGVVSGGPQVKRLRMASPAIAAGLKKGDIFSAIDGQSPRVRSDIPRLLGDGISVFADRPRGPPSNPRVMLSLLRPANEGTATVLTATTVEIQLPTWRERRQFVDDIIWEGADGRSLWVQPGTPAEKAGLKTGDLFLEVGGKEAKGFKTLEAAVQAGDGPVTFVVLRADGRHTIDVVPGNLQRNLLVAAKGGLFLPQHPTWTVTVPVAESFGVGIVYTGRMITRVVQTLRSLFRGSVKAKHLGGIITIFRGSKDHTKVGFMRGLLFLAMVSINLAILNILPIPVLDGGWLVFLIIEKIKGSPVSERTMAYFQWAGLIFVLGLMVYVTWNDVIRLIDGF